MRNKWMALAAKEVTLLPGNRKEQVQKAQLRALYVPNNFVHASDSKNKSSFIEKRCVPLSFSLLDLVPYLSCSLLV
ncbi:MAG: hypothetical protein V2B15_15240 [Bacteroidota bacterium]